MDEFINVWDTRMFTGVMAQLTRPVRTNQRVHFEVTRLGAVSPMRVRNNVNRCGKYVVSGTSDGLVSVWHTTTCIDTRSVTDFKPVTPTHMFAGTYSHKCMRQMSCAAQRARVRWLA
jgi:WD40 repeat protein